MQLQRETIKIYRQPLVCLTCNMPGAVKRNAFSAQVFEAGVNILTFVLCQYAYPVLWHRLYDPITGPEGYWCVQAEEKALKRICVEIEEGHALGRLFDLDVIGLQGAPLSRRELGLPARSCLVCGERAADCASRQKHDLEEVLRAVDEIMRGGVCK